MLRSLDFLALRNLGQQRTRTILSALAVALGAAMIVAASTAADGFRTMFESEEAQQGFAFMFDSFEAGLHFAGAVILLAAAFLIFNAFTMAVTQRRQQIGTLRSLGMTRPQVLRLVIAEALLTGGAGTLLGLALGPVLGRGVLEMVRSAGFEVSGGRPSFGVIVLAVLLGVGLTLLSVLVPARRATRISPLVALRQEMASPVRLRAVLLLPRAALVIIFSLALYLIAAPPGEWTLPPWNMLMTLILSVIWLAALVMILPAWIGWTSHLLARAQRTLPLAARIFGAVGRLMVDNLGRDRRRVFWTALTLAVSLTMIAGMSGMIAFSIKVIFGYAVGDMLEQPRWDVYPDLTSAEPTLETYAVRPEVLEDIYELAEGRAEVGGYYYVFVPEISAMVANFPSIMTDVDTLARPGGFILVEGDWKAARSIMEGGCGLLLPPGVAARNDVGVGETLVVRGKAGPVTCTVAGIGSGGFIHPASYVSLAAKDRFATGPTPSIVQIAALPGADEAAIEADLEALQVRHGLNADVQRVEEEIGNLEEINNMLLTPMNSLLTFAVIVAALGVVNTTMASVTERRQELGLLRAVGASRRQTVRVVTGEAALIGLLGGVFGLVAGAGISLIYALSQGGNSYGIADFPLWQAAWEATRPAIWNGLFGVIVAPAICAAAALFPARSILRGAAIETMQPERRQGIPFRLGRKKP